MEHLGDHSTHCRRAALSRECRVSLLFCVMQHPGVIEKSAGVTCSCLKWGNIIAALTLLTRCWESVKHKRQGEQRKTEKEKWRVAGLLQVSHVIKSVYSLHMNRVPTPASYKVPDPDFRTLRRRQWQPTPVLLPGNSHGQRSLMGCGPWDS